MLSERLPLSLTSGDDLFRKRNVEASLDALGFSRMRQDLMVAADALAPKCMTRVLARGWTSI